MMFDSDTKALYEQLQGTGLTRQKLNDLRVYLSYIGENASMYRPIPFEQLEYLLHYLLIECKIVPGNTKILDLGSGHGFPLAVFSAAGFHAYGVDDDEELVRESAREIKKKVSEIDGLALIHEPQIICADYYSEDFPDMSFKDGTTPKDMDVFFCYFYEESPWKKHEEVVLASLTYAKTGAIFLAEHYNFSEDLLREHGFSPIDPERSISYLKKC